jgi:disulfide bond formation protein DsbB
MTLAAFVNNFLGALTILAQALVVVALVFLVRRKPLPAFVRERALLFVFIVSLIATLGSLTYSDILGYEPCKLCWIQRILMYPQVVIAGLALLKKSYAAFPYHFALSTLGAVIAAYHYLLQLGIAPALPCSAVGYSVSCSQRFVLQYGYITIPLMAFSVFALIALVSLPRLRRAPPCIQP